MNQFNPMLTKDEPFFLADGKSVNVPLMRRLGNYRPPAIQNRIALLVR